MNPAPALFREGRALLIGVSEYADPAWNAPTAERDARALAETLADPQQSAYQPGQIELLVGAEGSRAGILAALERLAARAGADDVALIVFTGHGALGDDGLYYLASSDTRFSGARIVRDSGVSVSVLARALREIAARRVLLILNACASGQAGAGLGGGDIGANASSVLPEEQGREVLKSGEGRAIITASRADQLSYFVPEQSHSFFGQALIDGLRGSGVAEAGGYVGLFELYNSLHRQVRRAAQRIGVTQEPILTVVQAAGPFAVARYPGADRAGDLADLQRGPAADTAAGVRELPRTLIQNVGPGGVAVGDVGANAKVDVRPQSGLINFGDNLQAGNITIGDVAGGDLIKSSGSYGAAPAETGADPLAELPRVATQLAGARNVDQDAAEDAAQKIRQGYRAASEGDRERACQRLSAALALMQAMGNGYVNSLAKKVSAALAALS